jgi:hypothetical protein
MEDSPANCQLENVGLKGCLLTGVEQTLEFWCIQLFEPIVIDYKSLCCVDS